MRSPELQVTVAGATDVYPYKGHLSRWQRTVLINTTAPSSSFLFFLSGGFAPSRITMLLPLS